MRQLQNPNLDYIRRKALQKKIVAASKKTKYCPYCGYLCGKFHE